MLVYRKCAISQYRTTSLVVMWDATTMRVQLSPACVDSILAAISSGRLGQDLLVFQFQRLLVLIATVANLIPVGLLHMSVLAQEQKNIPFEPPIQGHNGYALKFSYPSFVDKTPVSYPGSHSLGAAITKHSLQMPLSVAEVWFSKAVLTHLSWYINCLEMRVMFLALKHEWPMCWSAQTKLRWSITSITRTGCVHAPFSGMHSTSSFDQKPNCLAVYIPGHANLGADILSRQGQGFREWQQNAHRSNLLLDLNLHV